MNDLILFEDNELKLEVKFDKVNDTVWLNSNQIVGLFNSSKANINEHIKKIYYDGELIMGETVRNFRTVQVEGSKQVERNLKYYNLDMIISIGYRVNSKKGIVFRKWATSVLKDFMIKGYAENQTRLSRLEKTLKLIDIASKIEQNLSSDEAKSILNVINNYGQALKMLDDYDHKRIVKPKGTLEEEKITYEEASILIKEMKKDFDSDLFGRERDNNFSSCIATIYQTYDGEDLYKSIEEKASNLLYLIVKNHTFIDGNKRIAAVIFLYYLYKNNILYKDDKKVIEDHTLVALALLIAQSNPREKEILVDLMINFLI